MSHSYIVDYSIPDPDTRARRSGHWQAEHLFFAYEDILCPPYVSDAGVPGSAYHIHRLSPDGHPETEPLLSIGWNSDGSREESGPLALPPRAEHGPSCPRLLIPNRRLLSPCIAGPVEHLPRRPAHWRNRHPRRRTLPRRRPVLRPHRSSPLHTVPSFRSLGTPPPRDRTRPIASALCVMPRAGASRRRPVSFRRPLEFQPSL